VETHAAAPACLEESKPGPWDVDLWPPRISIEADELEEEEEEATLER
jgi:hypothetical protein